MELLEEGAPCRQDLTWRFWRSLPWKEEEPVEISGFLTLTLKRKLMA